MFDLRHGVLGLVWVSFLYIVELTVAFICIISNMLPLYAVVALLGLVCAWYHNKTLL